MIANKFHVLRIVAQTGGKISSSCMKTTAVIILLLKIFRVAGVGPKAQEVTASCVIAATARKLRREGAKRRYKFRNNKFSTMENFCLVLESVYDQNGVVLPTQWLNKLSETRNHEEHPVLPAGAVYL